MPAPDERLARELLEYYRRAADEAAALFPRQASAYFQYFIPTWASATSGYSRTERDASPPSFFVLRSSFFSSRSRLLASCLTYTYHSLFLLLASADPRFPFCHR